MKVEVGRVAMISRKESAASAEDDSDDEFYLAIPVLQLPMFSRKWTHT